MSFIKPNPEPHRNIGYGGPGVIVLVLTAGVMLREQREWGDPAFGWLAVATLMGAAVLAYGDLYLPRPEVKARQVHYQSPKLRITASIKGRVFPILLYCWLAVVLTVVSLIPEDESAWSLWGIVALSLFMAAVTSVDLTRGGYLEVSPHGLEHRTGHYRARVAWRDVVLVNRRRVFGMPITEVRIAAKTTSFAWKTRRPFGRMFRQGANRRLTISGRWLDFDQLPGQLIEDVWEAEESDRAAIIDRAVKEMLSLEESWDSGGL